MLVCDWTPQPGLGLRRVGSEIKLTPALFIIILLQVSLQIGNFNVYNAHRANICPMY